MRQIYVIQKVVNIFTKIKNKIHLDFLEKELEKLNIQINKEKSKSKKFKEFKNTNNLEKLDKLLLRKKEIKAEIDTIKY
jgi:hypothetical protein